MMEQVLSIDIETFSPVDLTSSGVYKYAEHLEFQILLFAAALNNDPVILIDLADGDKMPDYLLRFLTDPEIKKTAFNAAFERICVNAYFGINSPADQWDCTMVRAAMHGLPFSLAQVAEVLHLPAQKDPKGKALIRYFSMPTGKDATKRQRNMPRDDRQKWELFRRYCIQDVEVERSIREALTLDVVTPGERLLWALDQKINDTGVMVDVPFVRNALALDESYKNELAAEASDLTQLNNPNSIAQLKEWIAEEMGEAIDSLSKDSINELLKTASSDELTRVLLIRQEMAKTSVKKYQAMADSVCKDGRIRGLLQYYGANRTGRWSGRLVQVQNLPQNHLKDLDLARQTVAGNYPQDLALLFGNVPDTLSQLIRTAFIAPEGMTFIVADFSAIEARVIAWLADEQWRMDVFASHGKIYEASASQMFHVPIEQVTKGSVLRQKGKIAELALGYQGGVGALEKMGAAKMGLKTDELPGLVEAWRSANKKIVELWGVVNRAARTAVEEGVKISISHGVSFYCSGSVLIIELPSKRKLVYQRPKISTNKYGSKSITYEGMNQTTKRWSTQDTYGGKLVENIVQAIARDCLAEAMYKLSHDFKIVMHIHDEVVIEVPEKDPPLEEVCSRMATTLSWAPGLLLRADGYVTKYYKKD